MAMATRFQLSIFSFLLISITQSTFSLLPPQPIISPSHSPSTRPDLFNDSSIVINGLVSPLSITKQMLKDAILRLKSNDYTILALALKVKFAELENLENMTIFALDDDSIIFGDGLGYVNNVRFHIVPNQFLAHVDLIKLPVGTRLETLVMERLVLTSAGAKLRINHVSVKKPDVLLNLKIAIHGIFMPFPHLSLPITAPVSSKEMDDGMAAAPQSTVEMEYDDGP